MTVPSSSLSERIARASWDADPLDLIQCDVNGKIVAVLALDRSGCSLRDEPRGGVANVRLVLDGEGTSVSEILRAGGVKIEAGAHLLRDLRGPLRKAFESSTLSE